MFHQTKAVVAGLVLSLACLVPSQAQENTSVKGGLSGVVMDTSGAAVPGATVTIEGPQGTRVVQADGAGRYEASGLVPGYYDVTAEKTGFKKASSKHNEVLVDRTASLNLQLPVGSASETVEVASSAVDIDTESTAVNTNLTDTFYNAVPVQRNVASLFYVAPGVADGGGTGTSNPSIGGASGLENLYVADGVTITDQAFGGLGTYNRYYGSLGTGINLAFIKEVDVKTAGFEPQYGKATGGVVQIVTKSGSNQFHGALAAYVGPGSWYASRYQLKDFGYIQTTPASTLSSPGYDASAEIGGYVPPLRDKLFFFGAIDPALRQDILVANPAAGLFSHGPYAYSTTSFNWAAKLTYALRAGSTLEASTYGDPSRHNSTPSTLSARDAKSVSSSYTYGSWNSVVRANTAITPSWTVSAAYTYNYNYFRQYLAENLYSISDRTARPFVSYGYGGYEPTKNDTWGITVDSTKTAHLLGEHTFSVGYSYDHTNFLDKPTRSGPLFAIPGQNAAGQDLATLFTNFKAAAVGQLTNASFRLFKTGDDTTCTYCPTYNGHKVYLQQVRGTYQGLNVLARGRYHVAYGNDNYQVNRFLNIDAGVRWEEQRIAGTLLSYPFTGSWSPRIGINIDPFGDRKNKVFFNYARYYYGLPLDAAIRQLGNEQDDTSFYWAPAADANGNAIIAPDGTATPVLDSAHLLNGTPRKTSDTGTVSKFGAPNFGSSTGEGIIPGTKGEYEDEYVIGLEHAITSSMVVSARYADRRFGRIIEDIGSQSPEGSFIGQNFTGGIANPSPKTDIAVNEQEVTYTADQYNAANPAGAANYAPPVAGCAPDGSNDTTFNNGDFFYGYDKNANVVAKGGACFLNLDTMDAAPGDGKPDGFVEPVRRYQAFEVELNKRFSNHWQGRINYRFAKLYGNYEGSFRNDNGQSDPGISSLFDFTTGALGLLGDQFKSGYLNTDRRNVGNLYLSYNIGNDTRYVSRAKGLTIGAGLRGQSGTPLNKLGGHPAYLNAGEVPVGGRGTAGRLPATAQLDLHADYPMTFAEKYRLKLAIDTFNVTNTQLITGRNQDLDQGYVGSQPFPNVDYNRPTSFQNPFFARASIRFEF